MKVELSEELITRFGLSKSIASPNLGMLRNHVNISGADIIREVDEDNLDENGEPTGLKLPYIITIDESTHRVLSIRRKSSRVRDLQFDLTKTCSFRIWVYLFKTIHS